MQKSVDFFGWLSYNHTCVMDCDIKVDSGCGTVWLVYLIWDQGVAGSNPVTPIDDASYKFHIGKHKYGAFQVYAGVVQW